MSFHFRDNVFVAQFKKFDEVQFSISSVAYAFDIIFKEPLPSPRS